MNFTRWISGLGVLVGALGVCGGLSESASASAFVIFNTSLDRTTIYVQETSPTDHDAGRLYDQLALNPYYDEGELAKSMRFYRANGQAAFDIRCNFLQAAKPVTNCLITIYKTSGTAVDPHVLGTSYVPTDLGEARRMAAIFKAPAVSDLFVSEDGKLRIPALDPGHPEAFGIFFHP